MNPIDLIVILLLVLGALAGSRAGLFSPVLGLAGAATGFGLALLTASLARDELTLLAQPLRALATVAALLGFVLVGEAIGAGIGAGMTRRLRGGPLRPLESLGGGAVGVAHVIFGVWVVGGMIAAGLVPGLGPTARESAAIRIVSERLPAPTAVAGRLLSLLDTTDLPQLFAGLEPPPAPPVDLPQDAEARTLAASAIASTARVSSTGCGPGLSVGSAFFVGAEHAITNAHVVAGSTRTTVTLGELVHWATVVGYDAEVDLALLHVPGAAAPPLELSAEAPGRGSTGVALGYPGGGELTVTPAAVTATFENHGPDIYGEGTTERTVVELQAQVRRGNSGGPLVVEPGVVGGVIFGASRMNADVGYAIGADEAAARMGPLVGATAAVGTGPCL